MYLLTIVLPISNPRHWKIGIFFIEWLQEYKWHFVLQDINDLIVQSYQKFGFLTTEDIDKQRNQQRLRVVQVIVRFYAPFFFYPATLEDL